MKEVILTNVAKSDILKVEHYIFGRYGLEVLLEFNSKFDHALEILGGGNVIFEKYENTKFRKFLLTKHNSIIYEDTATKIFVVKILQNFQDPDENYKSIIEEL